MPSKHKAEPNIKLSAAIHSLKRGGVIQSNLDRLDNTNALKVNMTKSKHRFG